MVAKSSMLSSGSVIEINYVAAPWLPLRHYESPIRKLAGPRRSNSSVICLFCRVVFRIVAQIAQIL